MLNPRAGRLAVAVAALFAFLSPAYARLGDLSISSLFKGSPIAVATSARMGGAITSIVWRNIQYVNAHDHGREFQSAVFYPLPGGNPTEAGSARDGTTNRSSTVVLGATAAGSHLATVCQAAYWTPVNGHPVSDATILTDVTVGWHGIPNLIRYQVSVTASGVHGASVIEALAAYMPPTLGRHYYSYRNHIQTPLGSPLRVGAHSNGWIAPGAVIANDGAGHSVGILGDTDPAYYTIGTYPGQAAKLNAVWPADFVPGQIYTHVVYIAIGSRHDVEAALDAVATIR